MGQAVFIHTKSSTCCGCGSVIWRMNALHSCHPEQRRASRAPERPKTSPRFLLHKFALNIIVSFMPRLIVVRSVLLGDITWDGGRHGKCPVCLFA